ncbi:MAG: BatA domain-containing protein [Bacteroidota bacterium]|nr:BatA domain-containing protein [Bacteroidota bacterium]
MTFLNPLYLIALAAAAIPIIIHLLNLRKARVIEFSTLAFLKELQKSRIRRLKIKQWILLALRILVIVFVVLAFTRPALRSSFGFLPGVRARTSVVILFDDSFSMLAADEGGRLFKQAREKALEIVGILEPGDEAALIRFSDAGKTFPAFTTATSVLRREIASAEPSYIHGDASEVLAAAGALLHQSTNFNKELYIITDEQRSHFFRPGAPSLQRTLDPSVRTFIIPVGAHRVDNTSIENIVVENSLFEKEKPVDLTVTVRNDGSSPLANAVVSVFLEGERVQQKTTDIPAGGRAQVKFAVIPKRSGFLTGFAELEDDEIPEDNRRYFSFFVPERISILIGPSGTRESTILGLALEPEPGATPFSITMADRGALLSSALEKFDVVALLGADFATPGFIRRLGAYVRAGGGLMLFPDGTGGNETFSSILLPTVGIRTPRGVSGVAGSGESFTTFRNVDFDHPLFQSVFTPRGENDKHEIESPRINAYVRLQGDDSTLEVITTTGGNAFLLDRRYGAGRVLAFAVPPNLSWSDFPLKGIFVPLLNRSIFYLSRREENVREVTVGATCDLTVPGASAAVQYELAAPSGEKVKLIPKSLSGSLVFRFEGLSLPGVYALESEGKTLRTIVANIDPLESAMEKARREEIVTFFHTAGAASVARMDRKADVKRVVVEARFGVELWKYMLGLALLCAIAEMLIAREVRRSQETVPPTP